MCFVTLERTFGVGEGAPESQLQQLGFPFRRRSFGYTMKFESATSRAGAGLPKSTVREKSAPWEVTVSEIDQAFSRNVGDPDRIFRGLSPAEVILVLQKFTRESGWAPNPNQSGVIGYGQFKTDSIQPNVKAMAGSKVQGIFSADSTRRIQEFGAKAAKNPYGGRSAAFTPVDAVPMSLGWAALSYNALPEIKSLRPMFASIAERGLTISPEVKAVLAIFAYGRGQGNLAGLMTNLGVDLGDSALYITRQLACGNPGAQVLVKKTGLLAPANRAKMLLYSSAATVETQRLAITALLYLTAL